MKCPMAEECPNYNPESPSCGEDYHEGYCGKERVLHEKSNLKG